MKIDFRSIAEQMHAEAKSIRETVALEVEEENKLPLFDRPMSAGYHQEQLDRAYELEKSAGRILANSQ